MKTYIYDITTKNLKDSIDDLEYKQIVNANSIFIQLFCGEDAKKAKNALLQINALFPQATTIGASSDGEIINNEVKTNSTIVSISIFDNCLLNSNYIDEKDSFINGVNLAKKITTPKTKLIIAFANGLSCNGEEFLNGIYSVAPNVIVAGGLSADDSKFLNSYVYHNLSVNNSGVVGISFESDDLIINNLASFEWNTIGSEHTITNVKKNRVYTIDNIPAVDFYLKYLGDDIVDKLPSIGIEFPLVINRDNTKIARAIIQKHEDGSLSFAGNLTLNEKVFLGIGNADIISSNKISKFNNTPVETFFIYSCMARRRFIPELIDQEILPFSLMADTSGFFTNGEFYTKNNPQLLNHTLTAISLSESKKITSYADDKISEDIKENTTNSRKALKNLIKQTMYEGTHIDKTIKKEIKKAKKRSKKSLKNFETLLDNIIEGTIICKNGSISDINKAMIKITGYTRDELLNYKLTDIINNSENKMCLTSDKEQNFEAELISKDKKVKSILVNIIPINHKKNYHIVTFVDFTEVKSKDMQLIQQSFLAQMGEMTSMIAHQWRQPLNAISSAAIKLNMLNELEALDSKELKQTISFIEDITQNMSKTINDFMNFSKPDNAKKTVLFDNIINSILPMIETQLAVHNIKINIHNDSNLSVHTYEKELAHILLNIIINARDALDDSTQKNKQIKLFAFQIDNQCHITIRDNAGGIDEDIINDIFNPYFTTKKDGKGTGLGLYMSKKIIQNHLNGTIEAKNTDEGAEFEIVLENNTNE